MNTLLQIAELGNFKCLMGDCPDTCCKGWEIPVDSKTYTLWKSDPKANGILSKLRILVDDGSPTPCSAKIQLKDDLSCSFLSETKLCTIQSSMGEEYLSHTCKSYPREINKFWGMFERSMTLSCPEVANTILSSALPLNLEYVEEEIEPWILREITEPNTEFSPELIVKLYEIRTLCLLKAQDRNLPIERRLAVLKKVAETANIDTTELCKLDATAQVDYFHLIKSCFNEKDIESAPNNNSSESLLSIFKPYVKENSYLGPIVNATPRASSSAFSKAENSILLEHVLFLLLLRSLFPFPSSNPKECFQETKNVLLLIQALLENQSSLDNAEITNLKDKITLIQKAMRILDHYEDLREKMRLLISLIYRLN